MNAVARPLVDARLGCPQHLARRTLHTAARMPRSTLRTSRRSSRCARPAVPIAPHVPVWDAGGVGATLGRLHANADAPCQCCPTKPPQDYVESHLKLSELGSKFADGTGVTLD